METYKGRIKIETLNDALVIFEACRQGILHRTTRRLLEKEKEELCGGKVYVFDEAESGIKRWTDGRLWGPSRIIKDFLVYHELATRDLTVKRHEPLDELLQKRIATEGLKVYQSSKGTFLLRKEGLLKKTISIKFNGTYQHMVIYEDVVIKDFSPERLLPPQAFEELRYLQPGDDILNSEKLPKYNKNHSKKIQKKRKEQQHQIQYLSKQLVLAQTDQRSNYQLYYQTDRSTLGIGNALNTEQTYVINNLTPSFDPYGAVNLTSETPLLYIPWSPNQPISFNASNIPSAIYPSICNGPQLLQTQMINSTNSTDLF
ncbi:Gti1/Pac2 family-domain-containing protein [Glomus cerebriforme]|uniref:Gti1/Pac2 family-domain-containing protein n=1 Tax=Glomus cerebriforme TaxID=658196 RepID=A0A397T3B3_9GLOM|nr:Gti1/Pac2 family-domain-containing protein [Glomus cerebriforme]